MTRGLRVYTWLLSITLIVVLGIAVYMDRRVTESDARHEFMVRSEIGCASRGVGAEPPFETCVTVQFLDYMERWEEQGRPNPDKVK